MIEKLESYNSSRTSIDGIHWEVRPNLEDIINKINEIIDMVNANSLGFSIPLAYSRHSFLGVDPGDTEKGEPVRHGRWIEREEWFEGEPKPRKTMGCSECGHSMYSKHDTLSYCPNCGAKMDEVEEILEMPAADGSTILAEYLYGLGKDKGDTKDE